MNAETIKTRRQWVLYDQKWKKFLGRAWVFRFVPFVEFVLGAGSMATGNVHGDSDFDVIVGVRAGRIFTARFLLAVLLGALGFRRKKLSHHEAARDKICLNHFVTKNAYRLSPPHNEYWRYLYKGLVPVFGSKESIKGFFEANRDWLGENIGFQEDSRHIHSMGHRLIKLAERFFSRRLGDGLELILKKMQVRRIEKGLEAEERNYKPRIRYGDDELEFHPDTRRIDEFIGRRA